ncbi:hypothetical protein B296_00027059 [Ensete ventricosum]|uniref:Uncharacterized protein n=1 Tax=Ensete ventricosum TaxID=4639 RepID=A0A426ZJ82_ENSVE|nr:hypothetical protein B296_00027059 [Ensete ventricosum]
MLTWPHVLVPSDNWPVDVADPTREAGLSQRTRARTNSAHSADTEADRIHWASTGFDTIILALEGGPMSQEHPFGNSGAEHHPEPNHPQPTEEVAAAVPNPNRFWRMMTDPGFPSPASNPAPFVVTAKAFLGLTSQVQALAGMVQTMVPYLPQLMQSTPIDSPDGPPVNGVTSSPKPEGPARGGAAIAPSR